MTFYKGDTVKVKPAKKIKSSLHGKLGEVLDIHAGLCCLYTVRIEGHDYCLYEEELDATENDHGGHGEH